MGRVTTNKSYHKQEDNGHTNTTTHPTGGSTVNSATSPSILAASSEECLLGSGQHSSEAKQPAHKTHSSSSSSWHNALPLRKSSQNKSAKYVTWSWRLLRRKQFVALLLGVIFVVYLNSMRAGENGNERVPVVHYSHVPGMKGLLIRALSNHSEPQRPQSERIEATVSPLEHRLLKQPEENSSSLSSSSAVTHADLSQPSSTLDTTTTTILQFNSTSSSTPEYDTSINATLPTGYLVWSENCKMPNFDPYDPDVMQYFHREQYKPCSKRKPLTRIEFNATSSQYVLLIEEKYAKAYSKTPPWCCYQAVTRIGEGAEADKKFSIAKCQKFNKSVTLSSSIENVLVSCYSDKKRVYINGYAMMPERDELRKRLESWRQKDVANGRAPPPSVLLIGIDSISRMNLIRAMPKTAQYLYDNEWFEMSGYNKIDDNTFPNLMAVLTGRNRSNAYERCKPTVVGKLDNCDFIWKTFRDHGYVTGYGEDETNINTFNYLKVGFVKPPVDYYLRPFLLAAESKLEKRKKSSLIYCLGYKHTAEFVFDYAVELATRYKDHPIFGLFWANTFSHNDLSDCTAMDQKMVDYLQRLAKLGILDRSIVIFFSDHGMRFGLMRQTLSGHFEERLPFMFMSLPPKFKQENPDFVNALNVNKNRLTNPYDLHMTLKHLLALGGRVEDKTKLAPAEDCPRCQTLLAPVPHNRSCEEVAIEEHWCTCIPYQSIYRKSQTVIKLAKTSIEQINDDVANFQNGTYGKICRKLELKTVHSAYRAMTSIPNGSGVYRLIYYTKPNNGLFEATLRYNATSGSVQTTGEVSRLDLYSNDSYCVQDSNAKKYCSCVPGTTVQPKLQK